MGTARRRRKSKTVEATVAREERAGRGGAESPLCEEVLWKRRVRAGGGATCTVEETYTRRWQSENTLG